MALTRTQYVANVREMMDAASSARWTDAFIKTVLGYVHGNEYSSLLGANPYLKMNQITVTTDANGQFAVSSLSTGSGNTKKNFFRLLALTDGNVVYRETFFRNVPVATTSNYADPYQRLYYQAGDYIQVLPVTSGLSLTAWVNWTPVTIDALNADSDTADFPVGSESIIWNTAAAELLMKGGAESEASQLLRSLADKQRVQMYQNLDRLSMSPMYMGYPDLAGEWAGMTGSL